MVSRRLLIALAAATFSCGDVDEYRRTRQFAANGRTYLLYGASGQVCDGHYFHMRDGGARIFDFRKRMLYRDLYSSSEHTFDSLDAREKAEVIEIARAAAAFADRKGERRQAEVFQRFLEQQ